MPCDDFFFVFPSTSEVKKEKEEKRRERKTKTAWCRRRQKFLRFKTHPRVFFPSKYPNSRGKNIKEHK
jgi:hypothetical protein